MAKLKKRPKIIAKKLKSFLKKLKARFCKLNIQIPNFNDFDEFLTYSSISPLLEAPFGEEEKRCFAQMENIARFLTEESQKVEKTTLVSVIMPVHNRIGTISSAIDSVLKQSYQNFELIIVDDGSDDGTTEFLEKNENPKIKIIKNKTCQGVSNARNKGLDYSKGKYIAYLDSDNTWEKDYLGAIVGAFTYLPDSDAVYGGQYLYRGYDKSPFAIRFGSFNYSLVHNRNYIDLNTFCHTKELYNRLGGFDEALNRYVDWDLIMRISETSTIYSIPVLLSNYYYDKADNTITNNRSLSHHLSSIREKQDERLQTRYKNTQNVLKREVSAIIPSYESLEDLKECIDSLLELNDKLLEIIVVDNASSASVVEYLNKLKAENKIKVILNDVNYGFTYAVNQGIGISRPNSDILLLNNDAIVTPGAIENMQTASDTLTQCGIVIPQQVLPPKTKTINTHVPFANSHIECDVSLSAHHKNIINTPVFHSGQAVELKFAPLFCAYIKRDILKQTKGLDAEYGRHYRSDRILCDYVRHVLNLKIYYIPQAIVHHKLQKSTDLMRSKPQNKEQFNLMFIKNQWESELAQKLGYKKAPWDN
ncbi:glycosyltransferase family 2 protein [Methanobacterium alcaliphilum]|uniref:glycosyltransferase family 2 protein n=1 Tax=Methanobacterium alcaliphilum TaxID=392018 RepID=UPI00200A9183|nr:glycosyltransferase [Methanobacterium alcaliphilum]MCK9152245.1 glycosyltransferase [Methanobacterium alcaliphilum]